MFALSTKPNQTKREKLSITLHGICPTDGSLYTKLLVILFWIMLLKVTIVRMLCLEEKTKSKMGKNHVDTPRDEPLIN